MKIMPMNLDDIDEIKIMENELYKTPWNYDDFLYEINENEFSYPFVVKEENEIIGYYIFWQLFDEINIVKLSVSKKYQGRGIGNILMEDIFNRVKILGLKKIFLEVRASNDKAINLYKKHGFISKNVRKNYYDNVEDALIMEKEMEE